MLLLTIIIIALKGIQHILYELTSTTNQHRMVLAEHLIYKIHPTRVY